MKLIELLVQETLNGNFKWPEGMKYLEQYVDGSLFSGNSYESYYRYDRVDDFGKDKVTREQYEAALAAAQQPVWNGEGLPPVGCECELSNVVDFYTHSGSIDFDEGTTVVVGGTVNFGLGNFVVVKVKGANCITDINPCFLRPIRSEADRLREAAINEIATLIGKGTFYEDAERIYNAITSGEVKLDV